MCMLQKHYVVNISVMVINRKMIKSLWLTKNYWTSWSVHYQKSHWGTTAQQVSWFQMRLVRRSRFEMVYQISCLMMGDFWGRTIKIQVKPIAAKKNKILRKYSITSYGWVIKIIYCSCMTKQASRWLEDVFTYLYVILWSTLSNENFSG